MSVVCGVEFVSTLLLRRSTYKSTFLFVMMSNSQRPVAVSMDMLAVCFELILEDEEDEWREELLETLRRLNKCFIVDSCGLN